MITSYMLMLYDKQNWYKIIRTTKYFTNLATTLQKFTDYSRKNNFRDLVNYYDSYQFV